MSRPIQRQADQYTWRVAALPEGIEPDDWIVSGEADPEGTQTSLFRQPKKQRIPKDPKPEPQPEQLALFPRPKGPYDAGTEVPFSTSGMDGYNWSDSFETDKMYDSIMKKYDAATPEIREWGTEWYDNARQYIDTLAERTNRTPEQVAAVMAAFSPRTAWDPNMTQATHFLLNYDPNDPDAMTDKNWPGLGENLERAKRIVAGPGDHDSVLEALQGAGKDAPKITSFYKNFMGDEDAVTMDTWMARAIFGEDLDLAPGDESQKALGWAGAYDKMADVIRRAAADIGITPRALQAIIWTQVNPTADYREMTPELYEKTEQRKEKQWARNPPRNPQPDYTKGPGWDARNDKGEPYLPPPNYTSLPGYNRTAAAGDDDDFFL